MSMRWLADGSRRDDFREGQRLVDHALTDEQEGVVRDVGFVEQFDAFLYALDG